MLAGAPMFIVPRFVPTPRFSALPPLSVASRKTMKTNKAQQQLVSAQLVDYSCVNSLQAGRPLFESAAAHQLSRPQRSAPPGDDV